MIFAMLPSTSDSKVAIHQTRAACLSHVRASATPFFRLQAPSLRLALQAKVREVLCAVWWCVRAGVMQCV
jgi:hypothetical protein